MRYILTLCLFSMAIFSYGQLKVGLIAGMNLNEVSQKVNSHNSHLSPTKIKTGFHVGPVLSFQLNNRMSLQSGLVFSTKGYEIDIAKVYEKDYNNKGTEPSGYDKTRLNYLEVPLAFNYTFWKQLSLQGGGYCAFGIGGKNIANYKAAGDNVQHEEQYHPAYRGIELEKVGSNGTVLFLLPDRKQFRGFDYGMQAGLGYQPGNFVLNVKYLYGLNNIYPRYSNASNDVFIRKNRNVYVSIGYYFSKAKD